MLYNKYIESDVAERRERWLKKKGVLIMKFEVLEHVSSFSKYDLDRLINGFLNNDDNLPFWAIGGLGDIELYFFHEGFGNINVVADWRDGFVLTVYVFPFGKDAYKLAPKNYASRSKALPVRVVEIFSDEIANLNIEGDVDAQYKAFIEMVFGKVAEREKEN